MTSRQFALSDLCEIVSSKRVFAADYKDEGVPFYRGKEVSQLARGESVKAELFISEAVYEDAVSRTGKISAGDVLMTAVGTLGNVYRVKEDDQEFYFKDGNVVWLRNFRPFVNSSFLRHWLGSPLGRKKVLNTAIGSTQAALTIAGLSQIQIQLPSLAKQQEIAEFLDTTDSLIRLNQGTASNLEQIAQTIFKSWFIDFDPVHAKSRGEQPEGMDAETAALFPDSFEDSELGLIPSGWTATAVRECFVLNYGKGLKAEKRTQGKYPVFGSNGVVGSHSEALVNKEHLVIGRKGTVGSVNLCQGPSWPIDTAFYVIPDPKFGLFYAYFLFRSLGLEEMDTDAAVPGLNRENVYAQVFVQPSPATREAYHNLVRSLFEQTEILRNQSQSLEEIREALLPRLISGELEIPEELLAD